MSALQNFIKDKSKQINNSIYDSTNLKWSKAIKDHKDILIKRGSFIEIVDFEKNISFRYNLKYFIDTKVIQGNSNIKNSNALWIIMILNNIRDDNDFINKKYIYVPNERELINLHKEFNNDVIE